jgi:O-antigen/teichoic acid export membrane protein
MTRSKRFAKDFIIYFLGTVCSKAINIILLPFYTYYLSVNDYGIVDIIAVTISLFVPLISLEIFEGVYRFLLDANNENEKKQVISSSLILLLLSIIASGSIVFVLRDIGTRFVDYYFYIFLAIILTVLKTFFNQILRGLHKVQLYAWSNIIYAVAFGALNIYLIGMLKIGVLGFILSMIIANMVSLLFIIFFGKLWGYIRLEFIDLVNCKSLIKYSVPLIPNVMNWWIMNVSDRYMLAFFLGASAVGIYGVSYRIVSAIFILNTVFTMTWQTNSVLEYNSKDRDEYYSKVFKLLVKAQISIVVIGVLISKVVVVNFTHPDFHDAWVYIPFLLIGTMFSSFSSFFGTGYIVSKDTLGALMTSVMGAVVNIIFNLTLIPHLGILGAAIATLIGFLSMLIVRFIQTKKYFSIKIDKKMILFGLISIILAIIALYSDRYVFLISLSSLLFLFKLIYLELFQLVNTYISKQRKSNVEVEGNDV